MITGHTPDPDYFSMPFISWVCLYIGKRGGEKQYNA